MKRIAFLATLVAFLVAFPGAAWAQRGANLTLSASADSIKFGRSVTLSGKLTGRQNDNKTIVLREDPFPFDDFDNVATTATNSQGEYSFMRMPSVNTRYQARQGGTESPVVTVHVRPAISLRLSDRTPAAGRRVRFFGRVCPEHDGASLRIQRRVAPKRWRTVRRTTLADVPGTTCSSYSRRLRIRRDGVYRTLLAAHADHAAGKSRPRRIDVHQ